MNCQDHFDPCAFGEITPPQALLTLPKCSLANPRTPSLRHRGSTERQHQPFRMPPPQYSDNLVRAAYHEAGHVIIRHHHGLRTPSVMIRPDGTGVTFAGGGIVDDIDIRLDVSLAGYAAESLFDKATLFPLVKEFITALRRLLARDSNSAWDDYVACVEMVVAEHPNWKDEEILQAMLDSHARVTGVLQHRWAGAQSLANGLLVAPGLKLSEHEITTAIT